MYFWGEPPVNETFVIIKLPYIFALPASVIDRAARFPLIIQLETGFIINSLFILLSAVYAISILVVLERFALFATNF